MSEKKVRGQDIVELFAHEKGFTEKYKMNFNLGEWYGFTKGDDILRAKLVAIPDQNGFYNVHCSKELDTHNTYCIIQTDGKFTVIKIEEFKNNKFVLNSDLTVKKDSGKEADFNREEFEFDDRIYKIQRINQTIYSIRQRVDENNVEFDEIAIKNLLDQENKCSYCGISADQIEKLDSKLKENKQNTFGLTSRNRGKTLEVDQINPKKGYFEGNITLSCYWCNNAKTDTFYIDEFKDIARGINVAWHKKFKALGIDESIYFPENSDIWESIRN